MSFERQIIELDCTGIIQIDGIDTPFVQFSDACGVTGHRLYISSGSFYYRDNNNNVSQEIKDIKLILDEVVTSQKLIMSLLQKIDINNNSSNITQQLECIPK